VLFIDATKEASVASFTLGRAAPRMDFSYTSHAISIPAIMATCQQCFERLPEVHVLAIKGYEFELRLGLTQAAQKNLDDATAYLSSGGASGRIWQGMTGSG
jgi:2-methylcitrate dehydratase PrpD